MISARTKNFLSYLIGLVIIVVGTVVLVAIAQGYRYNFLTGQIEETGLILTGSKPSGAQILLDGKHVDGKHTPYRIANILPGRYTISYDRNGSQHWQTTLDVTAKQVSFADYALLLPKNLKRTSYQLGAKVTQAIMSGSHRRIIAVSNDQTPGLWWLEAGRQPIRFYTAPSGDKLVMTAVDQAGDRVIASQSATATQTLMITTNPAQPSVDLTSAIGQAEIVGFNPANSDQLLLKDHGQLINLNWQTRTRVTIASDVGEVMIKPDRLIFRQRSNATHPFEQIVSANFAGDRNLVVLSLPDQAKAYQLDYFNFSGQDYVLVLNKDSGSLKLYGSAYNGLPSVNVLGRGVTSFAISPTGRFVTLLETTATKTLDLDSLSRFVFPTPLPADSSLNWLDDYHILASHGGLMVDFNGYNIYGISPGQVATMFGFADHKNVSFVDSSGTLVSVDITSY